jgi:exopolysaccharide biosynthesis polyprenyl glycosylphosphotransferase
VWEDALPLQASAAHCRASVSAKRRAQRALLYRKRARGPSKAGESGNLTASRGPDVVQPLMTSVPWGLADSSSVWYFQEIHSFADRKSREGVHRAWRDPRMLTALRQAVGDQVGAQATTNGSTTLRGLGRDGARVRARSRANVLARWLMVVDLIASAASAALVSGVLGLPLHEGLVFVTAAALLWTAIALAGGMYRKSDDLRMWASGISDLPRKLLTATVVAWPLVIVASVFLDAPAVVATLSVIVGTLFFATLGQACVRAAVHKAEPLKQRTLVVGSGEIAGRLITKLRQHDEVGLMPVGLLDDEVHEMPGAEIEHLGRLAELKDVLDYHRVDRVMLAFSRATHHQLLECVRVCKDRGLAVDIVPRLFELMDGMRSLAYVGGMPVLSASIPTLSRSAQLAKRSLDVVVAGVGLILVAPVLIVIAIAIKLESRGPVLFHHPRAGRGRRIFELVKFRSMYADAEQRKPEYADRNDLGDGVMFKIYEDPRVTRVGYVLRKYSLDELPQLWNVLRGQMSLVGPRPLILNETDALEAWALRRLELRPGLTGPWQIYGRSENTFQEMVRFDYQYVAGWSLARDIEILLATLPAVLSGRGAY